MSIAGVSLISCSPGSIRARTTTLIGKFQKKVPIAGDGGEIGGVFDFGRRSKVRDKHRRARIVRVIRLAHCGSWEWIQLVNIVIGLGGGGRNSVIAP